MPTTTSNIFVTTIPAEIAFCNLFEKRAAQPGSREQWDMTVLMAPDSPDLAALKKLAVATFKAAFPAVDVNKKELWGQPWETGEDYIARVKQMKGDKARDNDFMVGKVLVKSHTSLYAPGLSLLSGKEAREFRDEARNTCKAYFYPGCEVLAEYNVQPYQVGKNLPGVTLYLNRVCSLNRGERRGGGRSATETFSEYIGRSVDLDDDISF